MVPKILLNTQVKYYSIQEVVRFKFSTSKNMISDESSLIHVMPLHKDKEGKRRKRKKTKMKINKIFFFLLVKALAIYSRKEIIITSNIGAHTTTIFVYYAYLLFGFTYIYFFTMNAKPCSESSFLSTVSCLSNSALHAWKSLCAA